jgi:hypothetical protein
MAMKHERVYDMLSLYVAGALEPDEEQAVSEHLASGCGVCVAEADELREALAACIDVSSLSAPSPQLKQQVFARIEATRSASATPAAGATREQPSRNHIAARRGSRVAAYAAALAASVAVVGLWGWQNGWFAPPGGDPSTSELQQRLAEADTKLRPNEFALVNLAPPADMASLRFLYDELSGDLHVWLLDESVLPAANHVRVVDLDGRLIAEAELLLAGQVRRVVIDVGAVSTDGAIEVGQRDSEGTFQLALTVPFRAAHATGDEPSDSSE